MDREMELRERNIDDAEWIMTYINYLAGRDLYFIEEIHSYLKYATMDRQSEKGVCPACSGRCSRIASRDADRDGGRAPLSGRNTVKS